VRTKVDGDEVQVHVEDHGRGVAAADRERIFERFYRGGNRSGRGGYGLGLYLVKHIMDAHGGRIEVAGDPGPGSRFTLVFPIGTEHDRQESRAEHPGR
jgi:signal transduction histidine kinase